MAFFKKDTLMFTRAQISKGKNPVRTNLPIYDNDYDGNTCLRGYHPTEIKLDKG
tara:strand:+ start:1296 stop:1457 length:162 start_codon:yes stop_codon:yes gene_type:complete